MSQKTALVLGANGQDGSLICKSLLKKGFKVIAASSKNLVPGNNLEKLKIDKDIIFEQLDITNQIRIIQLISEYNPHEIYNLAAQSSVGLSFTAPAQTIKVIVDGTLNVLEACHKLDFDRNIFFAGSSEMFGNTNVKADINHTQNPLSPYSIAKQASFNLVKLYRNIHNLKCVTGVLFNHESPLRSDKFVTHKIINGAIKCSLNNSYRIELGNIHISRDWGWAPEYVEAMQLMVRSHLLKDQIICTGILTSLETFISMTFEKLDLDWERYIVIEKKYLRNQDICMSYGNPKQFKNELNWEAKILINEIIDNLLNHQLSLN